MAFPAPPHDAVLIARRQPAAAFTWSRAGRAGMVLPGAAAPFAYPGMA